MLLMNERVIKWHKSQTPKRHLRTSVVMEHRYSKPYVARRDTLSTLSSVDHSNAVIADVEVRAKPGIL